MAFRVAMLKKNLQALDEDIARAQEIKQEYDAAEAELKRCRKDRDRAANPFYRPFWLLHRDQFGAMKEAAMTCVCSIIFANAGAFVFLFMGLCGLLNLLGFLAYLVLFLPLGLPVRAFVYGRRFNRQRELVTALGKKMDEHDLSKALRAKETFLEKTRRDEPEVLLEVENEEREARYCRLREKRAAESTVHISDAVTQTDYYKAQKEKYYNIYMGNAAKPSGSSSADTLLDDWAHAKDSGVFNDTNW